MIPHIVTALLTVKGRKGYTVLASSAEIMHISPPASQLALPAPLATQADERAPNDFALALVTSDDGKDDGEDEDMQDATTDTTRAGASIEDLDADEQTAERAVVRPEELARIFETPAASGMGGMSVRAMFEAVVGLFGRKAGGVSSDGAGVEAHAGTAVVAA